MGLPEVISEPDGLVLRPFKAKRRHLISQRHACTGVENQRLACFQVPLRKLRRDIFSSFYYSVITEVT